jgi:poly(3-hydroxybutyrate) depolymerase
MGGFMASVMPVREAMIIAAAASFASIVPVLVSPVRSLKEIPHESGPNHGEAASG